VKGQRSQPPSWLVVFAVLAAIFGGLDWYSVQVVRRAEAEFPPTGQFVTVEGLRLHYVSEGSGKPVVFFHGYDGVLQDYSLTMLDRAAREYHAIAFDLPGHGYSERSSKEVTTPIVQARLLRGAFRTLGIAKPVLVGHSGSAALALAYALDYQDELAGVVLLGGFVYGQEGPVTPWYYVPQVPLLGDLWVSTLLVPIGHAFAGPIGERAFWPDPAPAGSDYARAVTALSLRPSQFTANAEDIRTLSPSLKALSPRYGEIRVPVVIVTGDSDLVVNPEQHAYPLHQAIPHSKLMVLPHTGHMIPHTRPEAVVEAIRAAWEPLPTAR
jgi:pimeloyl-ACP methyl ester carboxylesterase